MIFLKALLFFAITKIIYREKEQRKAVSKAGVNYLLEPEGKKLFAFLKKRRDKQAERDYVLLRLCRATGLMFSNR